MRFDTIEDLIDGIPSDNHFAHTLDATKIRDAMDKVPLDHDWEKYRLSLFLKTGDFAHPVERLVATSYMKTLEEQHRSRYYGTNEGCIDGFVMVNGKCVPEHSVEEYTSEQGYYDEDDLVPPITSSSYRVPKENKRRKMSYYGGAK